MRIYEGEGKGCIKGGKGLYKGRERSRSGGEMDRKKCIDGRNKREKKGK